VKYTKLYSGGEPELFEGEIFRTIIPLGANVPIGNMRTLDKVQVISATQGVTEKVTEKVTEDESEILAIISQNGEITQDEIAVRLGVSRKTISLRVRALKEKKLIRRIGSDTKGCWEVTVGDDS
jgi:ATP-dependent DNA helicase RecG